MPQKLGSNQKKWIDALRSGEFKQGQIFLCSGGHHCCGGVGCEVLGIEKRVAEGREIEFGKNRYSRRFPEELIDLLALRDWHGAIGIRFQHLVRNCGSLVHMNDLGEFTFAEIADFCEQHPEAVFTEPR